MTKPLLALLCTSFLISAPALAHNPLDPPEAQANVDAATRLARQDLAASLFFCQLNPSAKVGEMLKQVNEWFEPTKLFDDLYYVGNHFVGVFVLKTSDGLILFDSGTSLDDAEKHVAPGLVKLGLDPKDIKYIVVTHGHWDHFGGALWFQKTYNTPVGLSALDWDLIARLPADAREIDHHPLPEHDQVISDGQVLTVGGSSVNLYITPGHTPGTVSAIFTAHQNGKPHVVSLLGSTAFPSTIEPTDRTDGLAIYRKSIERFRALSLKAGADIAINTHLFAFGGIDKLSAAQASGKGDSFLIGTEAVGRLYSLLDHCMQAAEARIRAGVVPHNHH